MGTRTGAKMGAAITEWKMKNRVTSAPARILSKIGGFIGTTMEIIAAIGVIACVSVTDGAYTGTMIGYYILGLAIDLGSHWIAMKIDKKPDAKE